MQVHTFIAESATEAVDRIRNELGPTAVVLNVRKLPRTGLSRFLEKDRIEVQAGIPAVEPQDTLELSAAAQAAQTPDPITELRREIRDLKEQISQPPRAVPTGAERSLPGAEKGGAMARFLVQTGLLPLFAEQIALELSARGGDALPFPEQLQLVREILRAQWRLPRMESGVHVFVGVPGSGKSSVLCKMLAHASLVEGRESLVYQLDAHLANASPQPGVYSEIMGADFQRVCPAAFEAGDAITLVDLPGVALGDNKGLEAVRDVIEAFGRPVIHLVLNAAYEMPLLLEQVRFFSKAGISDLVLTHLDEELRWGKAWNFLFGTNYGIRFLASGQNIPGDLLAGTAELVLSRQFGGKAA